MTKKERKVIKTRLCWMKIVCEPQKQFVMKHINYGNYDSHYFTYPSLGFIKRNVYAYFLLVSISLVLICPACHFY